MKRGVHDNNRYAFRCKCPTGATKYPSIPLEGIPGYLPWLDEGECREAQTAYKEGKLLLFKPKVIDEVIGDATEPKETEW